MRNLNRYNFVNMNRIQCMYITLFFDAQRVQNELKSIGHLVRPNSSDGPAMWGRWWYWTAWADGLLRTFDYIGSDRWSGPLHFERVRRCARPIGNVCMQRNAVGRRRKHISTPINAFYTIFWGVSSLATFFFFDTGVHTRQRTNGDVNIGPGYAGDISSYGLFHCPKTRPYDIFKSRGYKQSCSRKSDKIP